MDEKAKLDLVKNYLNVDFEDDDNLIKALIESGEEYLKNAGVKETQKNNKLYFLALSIFVHFYYINREETIKKFYTLKNDNPLSSIIQQLKFSE